MLLDGMGYDGKDAVEGQAMPFSRLVSCRRHFVADLLALELMSW